MKRWLYVVQQRLAITNTEATALLTISLLLVLGLIVGEVRSRIPQFGEETYAASEQLFRQGTEMSVSGTPSVNEGSSLHADTTAGTGATKEPPEGPEPAKMPERSTVPGPTTKAASTIDRASAETIDLNTATAKELQQLPRIGPKIAERIIAFRRDYGPFRDVAEITEIRGIGEATLERLRPFLRLGEERPISDPEQEP